MEWKTVKLGDILKITGGQLYKGDLLGTGDNLLLGMGCVSFLEKFLMKGARQYGGDCLDKNIGRPGDIVLATRQQSDNLPILAMPAIIPEGLPAKKIIIGSNLYKVNVTDPDFNSRFIYWLLKTPEYVNYISSVKTGTTVKMITIKDVESYTFLCPPKESRDKISKFLWDLDDKIENNNRINANLEAQAQALFKSWFVDFEPLGGTMPEDWKEGTIGEMCTCYLGGTPSRAKSEYWNGDIPWINSGEVNKYRIIEGSEYITELGLKKSATKLLPKKTTVLAITGATLGQVSLLEIEACANQSVIGILENEKMPYEFIYPLIVNDIEKIILNQTGGAQQHINKDNVERHKIIIPTDEIMAKYKAIQAPLFETIANNCLESSRLATLRDTLLPKLMKGEIVL